MNFLTIILLIFLNILTLSGCGKPSSIDDHNLDSYHIQIPGIQNDYEFLFLTDNHIIIPDKNSDKQLLEYSNNRLSSFKDLQENDNSIEFEQWITYANAQSFDGLLLGGDIIDSPSSSNMDYLASSLDQLELPYVYTLGNHDWTYPWEYMTDKGKKDYLPLFLPYMENNTYIHEKDYEDFTIVAVDNSNNQIDPSALEEYKKILEKNKPVILMLHVPLYTESVLDKSKNVWGSGLVLGGGIHGGIYPNDASAEFIQLTTAENSPVIAVLAGHVHFADKNNIIGEQNIPQIIGDAGFKGKGTIIKISSSSQ